MFASATSGDRPNNSKFSTCSIGNISNVLDAIEDSKKRNCFSGNLFWFHDYCLLSFALVASAGAFCGNKIVEAGEECDCGFDVDECKDKCCYPRVVSEGDRAMNYSAAGCHRRSRTSCSPSQGKNWREF
jgi:disintegrin and metalloproteinase domain-containing protein 10